ncbi:MAG: hypothetical protein J5870_05795 [Clostridia bacterium]|nr:hypothetical protein [Clostridia bacterium]
MRKICAGCGYKTEEKDLRCPICGGALYRSGGAADPCDTAEEAEWNGGFHNDFTEGRKTGEYCDPELEKLTNGGEHYHGTAKTTYSQQANELPQLKLTPKAAMIITIIAAFIFPFVGPLIALGLTKEKSSEAASAARKAAVVLLILTVVAAIAFGSVNL